VLASAPVEPAAAVLSFAAPPVEDDTVFESLQPTASDNRRSCVYQPIDRVDRMTIPLPLWSIAPATAALAALPQKDWGPPM
jgi:hypothetical protein